METIQQPPAGQPVPTSGAQPPKPPSTTSTSSVIALVLGILSLTCCGFLSGIPAIFIGRSELKKVQEGSISESNRMLAKIGMVLGIIGTVLSVLGTIVYVIIIAFTISTGIMQHGGGF